MKKDNKKKLSSEELEQASGGMLLGYTAGGEAVYTVDDPNVAQYANPSQYSSGGYADPSWYSSGGYADPSWYSSGGYSY